jgi:hypothetical protein
MKFKTGQFTVSDLKENLGKRFQKKKSQYLIGIADYTNIKNCFRDE